MFLSFHGPPPRFSAHGRSRLGLPPRPLLVRPSPPRAHGLPPRCAAPFPRAASRPALERDRRVATMRRRRPPRGSHGLPPLPRARLHLLSPRRSTLHSPALPLCFAHTELALSPSPQPPRHFCSHRAPPLRASSSCPHCCSSALVFVTSMEKVVAAGPFASSLLALPCAPARQSSALC